MSPNLPEHINEVYGQVAEGEHTHDDDQHLSDVASRGDDCDDIG